jgi:hypothetical protein
VHTGAVADFLWIPPRDPLEDPLDPPLHDGRPRRHAGPDFLGDGWTPYGVRRRARPEPESDARSVLVLIVCVFGMIALLLSGAVTDGGRSGHVWALVVFVLMAAAVVLQLTLMVRRWRRNRTVLRIDPPTR